MICTLSTLLGATISASAPAAETTADPLRPPAIAATNVPAIPDELFERLRQYQETRSASFAGWAQSGQGILIATRFGNTVQLHRVYEPGGRREQITFFREPVSGRLVPDDKRDTVLMSMASGGNENYQIYRLDRETGRAIMLTDGKSRNTAGPIARDGSLAVFASNKANGRDMDLYALDPRSNGPAKMILAVKGSFWSPSDLSPDGKRLLMIRYVSINESYPAVLDVAGGALTELDLGKGKAGATTAVGEMKFSRDGKSTYFTSDVRGEFQELARLGEGESQPEWLTTDIPWDVGAIEVDRTSDRVAFTVNEGGVSSLYLTEGENRRKLDVPLGVILGIEFSPDGKHLGMAINRPDAPSDVYSIDLEDGKLTRWTYSEVGGLNAENFVRPTTITSPSFDGRKIPAFYYRPAGASKEKPAPVLISIHGGPESQYRPTFSASTQFYVNDLGIALIAPNVRGSAGYGKTYLKLDNAEKREDSVRDIGAILDWVKQQPELDAGRVAVIGGSYGGYMVLASLVNFPDRIKAGVDIVGIASFKTFLTKTSAYRQDLRRAEYGDERDPRMQSVFERIDPLNNAARIKSALMVAHGKNDPRVPFFEAEQIAAIVGKQGQKVWTVYADNEGHGFAKKDNSDYLSAAIALFLRQNLQ